MGIKELQWTDFPKSSELRYTPWSAGHWDGVGGFLLTSEMMPHLLAHDDQKLEVGVEVSGQNGSSACLEEKMNNIPSLVLAGSSSDNFCWEKQIKILSGVRIVFQKEGDQSIDHTFCHLLRVDGDKKDYYGQIFRNPASYDILLGLPVIWSSGWGCWILAGRWWWWEVWPAACSGEWWVIR